MLTRLATAASQHGGVSAELGRKAAWSHLPPPLLPGPFCCSCLHLPLPRGCACGSLPWGTPCSILGPSCPLTGGEDRLLLCVLEP